MQQQSRSVNIYEEPVTWSNTNCIWALLWYENY